MNKKVFFLFEKNLKKNEIDLEYYGIDINNNINNNDENNQYDINFFSNFYKKIEKVEKMEEQKVSEEQKKNIINFLNLIEKNILKKERSSLNHLFRKNLCDFFFLFNVLDFLPITYTATEKEFKDLTNYMSVNKTFFFYFWFYLSTKFSIDSKTSFYKDGTIFREINNKRDKMISEKMLTDKLLLPGLIKNMFFFFF